MKPRLLDLFCGAGGASVGYARAGFDVVGIDIRPQPHYPFEFEQMDAMEALREIADGWYNHEYPFAIHASPPCQAFTQMSARYRGKGGPTDDHPDLLTPTRALLAKVTVPWVIENVVGARRHMATTLSLHGGQFGLGVYRPRLFESNVMLLSPGRFPRPPFPVGVYGTKPDGRTTYRYRNNGNMKGKSLIRAAKSVEEAQEVMGIDWMPEWDELREAIPAGLHRVHRGATPPRCRASGMSDEREALLGRVASEARRFLQFHPCHVPSSGGVCEEQRRLQDAFGALDEFDASRPGHAQWCDEEHDGPCHVDWCPLSRGHHGPCVFRRGETA